MNGTRKTYTERDNPDPKEKCAVCYLICANLLKSFRYFFNWHREVLKLERGTDLGKRYFQGGEMIQYM